MLSPNAILQGRYRVIRAIGGGGMGTVYLTEDSRLPGRRCAIKEMSPAHVPAQDRNWAISAFKQEAQILARLQHPGITAVTDFFAERGNWYLIMEYVEGQTLEDALQAAPGHRLPDAQVRDIFNQLCQVLEYLHGQQPPVVFRDLKPSNVMLTPDGKVKLIDFGIARFFKAGQGRDTVNLGTPGYAAPEQYGGQGQTDVRADVYGLGVLLHEMLTGHDPTITPFRLPPANSLNNTVPYQVGEALQRATEQDPNQRFPSIRDFRAAIVGQTNVLPPQPPAGAMPPWIKGVVGIGVGLMLIAALGVGVFQLMTKSAPNPTRTMRPTRTPTPAFTATSQPPAVVTVMVTTTPQAGDHDATQAPAVITVMITATPEPTKQPTSTPTRSPTRTATRTPKPSTSTTSDMLVYACGSVGDADICTLDLRSNRAQTIIRHADDDTEPDWSPDGRQIVFQSDRTGNYDLFVADSDGTDVRNLTNSSREERGPDWSPDGSQVVYEVGDGRNNGELWVMDANGRDQHRLLDRSVSGRAPTWSPDGQKIAFMRQEADGYWQIYVLNLNNERETKLSHRNEHCRFPTWSPDSRYLAYNTYDRLSPSGQTYEVWRVLASGSGSPQRLTFNDENGRPSWSPDGQSIVFNHGDDLYRMDADGDNVYIMSNTEQGWAPDWH